MVAEPRASILITRPIEEAEPYACELEAGGYRCLISPMLELQGVEYNKKEIAEQSFDGLIFTSQQGVRFFDHYDFSVPAFCVGERTAILAREAGYANVYSADGTAYELSDFIFQHYKNLKKKPGLLHVRGRDVARDPALMLREHGFTIEALTVYKAEFSNAFSDETIEAMRSGTLDAVIFFSKRTANNFMHLVERESLFNCLSSIKALCISQSVVECVRVDKWSEVCLSDAPDRASIRTLLDSIYLVRS